MSGYDTGVTAEGSGKLNYNLVIDNNDVKIGETVSVTISPVNEIAIFARLQNCQVTYKSVSISIFNWNDSDNEIDPVCELTAAVETGISQKDLKFSWAAFKWSTQTDKNLIESQEISCEISLSKDEPSYNVDGCESSKSAEKEEPTEPSFDFGPYIVPEVKRTSE